MIHRQARVHIARPPDEVIGFLAEMERQVEYWESVQAVRLLSGTPGAPGARYERVLHAFGRPRATVVEVLERAPGHRFAMQSLTPPLRVRATFQADRAAGGTDLRLDLEARASGTLWLLYPWLGRMLGRKARVSLARLRGILEARNAGV